MGGMAAPVDLAPDIFNHPQTVMDILNHGGEAARKQLADLYPQWIEKDGTGKIDPTQAAYLGKFYPGTPFSDPKAWIFQNKAIDHLSDVLDTHPDIKARYDTAVQQGGEEILREQTESLIKQARSDAKLFGPMGDQLERQISDRMSKGDWKGAGQDAAKFYQDATPDAAMKEVMAKREQAAQKAIQAGYHPTPTWDVMKRRARFVLPYLGGSVGAMAVGAHTGNTYAFTMGGVLAAAGTRESLVNTTRGLLSEPKAATEFYNATQSPGKGANLGTIARQVGRVAMSNYIAQQGIYNEDNPSDNQPASAHSPAPEAPGPAMNTLNRLKAEQIAPTPGGADRAVELTKQIARTKSIPDVQRDLASGRLSQEEVKKILQQQTEPDPSQIVQDIPLQDALSAVEMGTSQEKQVLVPLLMERMKAELPQIQNKTVQAKLTQRMQKLLAEDNHPPVDSGAPLVPDQAPDTTNVSSPDMPQPNEAAAA